MSNDTELKVGWLVSNVRTNDFEELFTTELASSRMRAGVYFRLSKGKHRSLPSKFS